MYTLSLHTPCLQHTQHIQMQLQHILTSGANMHRVGQWTCDSFTGGPIAPDYCYCSCQKVTPVLP